MNKKKLLISCIAMSFSAIHPLCAQAESFAHLENDDGIVDVVGFEVNQDDNAVFVLLEYQNTKNESASPLFEYSITVYQDGIELESAYFVDAPDGYKSADTKIQTGATLKYYECFELSGSSSIDVEVSPMFNFDKEYAKCTFDLSAEVTEAETEIDYKTMYEELKQQYDELLEKYEKLIAKQK